MFQAIYRGKSEICSHLCKGRSDEVAEGVSKSNKNCHPEPFDDSGQTLSKNSERIKKGTRHFDTSKAPTQCDRRIFERYIIACHPE